MLRSQTPENGQRRAYAVPLPDAFKEDWTPPKPVLTPREITLNRAVVSDSRPFELPRNRAMTEEEIKNAQVMDTPLRRTGGRVADEAEKLDLGQRLLELVNDDGRDDFKVAGKLKSFVDHHPDSGYAASLLIEAAEIEWVNGFFQDSLKTFQRAWDGAKGHDEADDRRLAEMALGRLLERRALIGEKEELRALLAEIKDRPLGGYADDGRVRAKEVLWHLDNRAERNVFCGFSAANAVCVPLGERPIFPDVHDEGEKAIFIRDGLSAFELAAHSKEAGGTLRVIRRGQGAKIAVPSIVHWSFRHYSAITEELNGKYRVKDVGLRFDSWVPKEAIDAQSSGCFLVPAAVAVPKGYTPVGDAEAKTIFGRHCIHAREPEGTQKKKCDPCDPCCKGMATYTFDLMNPGLYVQDTPVGYAPPYGPAVQFTAAYSQRSTVIPDLQTYSNLGPRWTHSFQEITLLSGTTNPDESKTSVKWVQSDGSYFDYSYVTATQTYSQDFQDRPHLNYLTAGQGGPGYELRFADGSRKLFTKSASSKYLLTQIIDPVGNAVTLQYDGSLRLTTITDALGQATTISYATEAGDNVTSDTKKIRKVTDPFSRFAKFKYTTTGQLEKIIDPVGIESKFRYASGDFIDRLTTPYGVTEFSQGDVRGLDSSTPGRFLEARDSQGDRERVESNDFALPDGSDPNVPAYEESPMAPSSVTVGAASVPFLPKNENLFYRNTFYWDKKQMFYAAGDYSQARIYNWLAVDANTISSVLASTKEPLEGRVWFNYPNQNSAHTVGDLTVPTKTVRAVEGAGGATTWIMSQASYNSLGLPTGTVDPEGREMKYEYYMAADGSQFTDNQDVHYVKVNNSGSWETLMTVSQYKVVGGKSVHLPEIMTDAAGVQTTISYNAKGQVASVTVSKGGNTETTNYIYDTEPNGTADAYGYLIRVEHTSPVNAAQFVTLESRTYDSAKRVRTVTDADGYTVTYDYDSLDRVTLVTHPDATTEQLVYTDGTKQTLDVWASKDRSGRWTRTRYNALRQPVMQLDALARLTQWEWCKCGSLSKLIDAQGKVTFWKRDIQGRVTDKILPDTKKYSYTYQPLSGRVSTVAYPNDAMVTPTSQTTFTNEYYGGGQLKKKDYRDAAMADVTYGAADYLGRPTTITDGTGTTTASYVPLTSASDGAGQTATVNGPLAHDTLRYSYDYQGRMTKHEIVSDDLSTASRSEEVTARDSLGRVTQMVNNLGTFNSTFNTGNLSAVPNSVTLPGGFSTALTRYAANTGANALRLQTINHKDGAATTVQKHDYTFNLTGNLTTWNRTNAASVVTGWTLRHDNADQLTDLEETVGGTSQKKESWHYDTAGNIASSLVEPTGQSASLRMRQHTGRNQLTSMGGAGKTLVEGTTDEAATVTVNSQPAVVTKLGPSGPWRFQKEMDFPNGQTSITVVATDGANNVRTKNYTVTVDAASGARTLEYDDNGNLRKVRDGSNTVIRLCEWDAGNHLLAVQSAEVLAAGVKRTEFVYDGAGRRVRQVEKEHNGSAWVTQSDWTYVWDGMEVAQKRDTSSNALLVNYFSSGELQGGDAIVYQTDHLGSVRGWYRVSDGVRGEAEFSAYGQRTITTTGPGVPERGYTGHLQHAASGLILAPFRVYDAELGRWISEDPNGEDGGMNLYGYVGNGAVGWVDPLGLEFHWYDAFNWYADHGGTAMNNFLGGFSNSWLMGAPNLLYGATGLQGADPCSGWTTAGDWTATGIAVASSMGSGALKKAAAQRFAGLSRKQVASALRADRAQLRKALGGATGDGLQAHHSNPLLGHPGSGASTMFPTAGLPAAVRNSALNGELLDQAAHMAAHARMEAMEAAMRGLGLGSNSASAARAAMSAYRTQNCK